jgi:ABC-type phosphate transport system substrate-binding protein
MQWLAGSRKIAAANCLLVTGMLVGLTLHQVPVSRAESRVKVRGSCCGTDFVRTAIGEFENRRREIKLLFFFPREDADIPGELAKRECDVGMVLEARAPKTRKELGPAFERVPVARFAVCVIANPRNPVRNLAFLEVNRIFRGKITSWEGVAGGHKASIELFSPILAMNEAVVFRTKVLQGAVFSRAIDDRTKHSARQKMTTEEVVQAVVAEQKGIAFIPMRPGETVDKRVRVLGIAMDEKGKNPVLPTPESIADGSYWIADTLAFYVHPDAPPLAREFCEFIAGPEGAKIAKNFGLWPEYELKKVRGESRLKEMQAGKGTPVRIFGLAGGEALAHDLALEFVKAKATVQVKWQQGESLAEAAAKFLDGGELLLWEGGKLPENGERKAKSEEPSPPTPLPKGEGTKTPAPLPKSGEGSKATIPLPKTGEGSKTASPAPGSTPPATHHAPLTTHPLGNRAVGVIVHRENAVKNLTLDDLRQIYAGDVEKWPGTVGKDAKMKLIGLPSDSPAMRLVEEKLGNPPSPPTPLPQAGEGSKTAFPAPRPSPPSARHARVTRRPDTAKVIQAVAGDPGAIGLVDLAAMPPKESSVKLLAIVPNSEPGRVDTETAKETAKETPKETPGRHGPALKESPEQRGPARKGSSEPRVPAPDHVPDGYPLAQPVTLYVHPRANQTAKDLADFLAAHSPEVQEVLKQHGIIPAPPPMVELAKLAGGRSPTESPPTAPGPVVLGQWDDEPGAKTAGKQRQSRIQDALTPGPSPASGRGERDAGPSPAGGRGETNGSTPDASGREEEAKAAAGRKPAPTQPDPPATANTSDEVRNLVGIVLIAAAMLIGLVTVNLVRKNRRQAKAAP